MTLALVKQKLKGRVEQENSGAGLTLFNLPLPIKTAASHLCSQAALSNVWFFWAFSPLVLLPGEGTGGLSPTSPGITTSPLPCFIAPILSADFQLEPQPDARLS